MPLPEANVDAADLILTPDPQELTRPIPRYVQPAPRPSTDILAELSKARDIEPVETREARPKRAELTEEEREQLVQAALEDVLSQGDSAFRPDAELFQEFLVRCRIRRLTGATVALPEFRQRLAIIRSGADEETRGSETWAKALDLSRSVTDDLKAVFLLIANAAITGQPCPSDQAIARAYGTHSARRARRLLSYFEEQGLIVLHQDRLGARIAAFPDLDAETAPGNPDQPETETRSAAE
jgi:hypothetical protein